jgi:hypothetical protein
MYLMLSSTLNLFDLAQENALDSQHLPPLKPDSKQHCLEFFFDNPEIPAYVILDGQLIVNEPARKETGVFQLLGDDGFLYIQADNKVLLNRIEEWNFPVISLGEVGGEIAALEAAIKRLSSNN